MRQATKACVSATRRCSAPASASLAVVSTPTRPAERVRLRHNHTCDTGGLSRSTRPLRRSHAGWPGGRRNLLAPCRPVHRWLGTSGAQTFGVDDASSATASSTSKASSYVEMVALIKGRMEASILGQEEVKEGLLLALFAGEHAYVEGTWRVACQQNTPGHI